MMHGFNGCLVSLPTPFTAGAIDESAFAAFVDWHIGEGSKGLVVVAETGEASTLTSDERDTVIKVAVKAASGRVPIIAGVIANSTEKAVVMAHAAGESGADAALVTVPYYNKPTQDGMVEHFQAVARSSGFPILLHNEPGSTGVDLLPQTIARLADCPGVSGVVDASTDPMRLAKIADVTPQEFLIISGDDARGPGHTIFGGHGWLSVGAGVLPRAFSELHSACATGHSARASAILTNLGPFIRTLGREASPATLKHALKISAGWDVELRLPLVEVSAATAAEIEAALAGLHIPFRQRCTCRG